jgi:ankyrin repeat protein
MRNFNSDIPNSRKLTSSLLQLGGSLKDKNKMLLTPLSQALFFAQTEAIRFALSYNMHIRRNDLTIEQFDFNETSGQYDFTPIHFAVYQNNFQLMCMLLESTETIDMEIKDKEDRMPLDLCLTISAIYKTLRRALTK